MCRCGCAGLAGLQPAGAAGSREVRCVAHPHGCDLGRVFCGCRRCRSWSTCCWQLMSKNTTASPCRSWRWRRWEGRGGAAQPRQHRGGGGGAGLHRTAARGAAMRIHPGATQADVGLADLVATSPDVATAQLEDALAAAQVGGSSCSAPLRLPAGRPHVPRERASGLQAPPRPVCTSLPTAGAGAGIPRRSGSHGV